MKAFKAGNTVNFVYDGGTDNRVVRVEEVGPDYFAGIDLSKKSTTDKGYRKFKFAKLDMTSLSVILDEVKDVVIDERSTVPEVLGALGILDKATYDKKKNVYLVPKNILEGG